LFVDSKVTIAAAKKEYKRQIAEMEKAAKAAFKYCIALPRFARRREIIAAGR
jgi:hypothetical protein